ncbi:hypothetical protein BgiMline_021441, partial [Biomphalaria glabrata]
EPFGGGPGLKTSEFWFPVFNPLVVSPSHPEMPLFKVFPLKSRDRLFPKVTKCN